MLHKEILSTSQQAQIAVVENFCRNGFYLAGGTALALQFGHRESIDFDLFTEKEFDNAKIVTEIRKITPQSENISTLVDQLDQISILLNSVKFTFLRYPFSRIDFVNTDSMVLASPLAIAAMKAYALGRRSKWKDYVDLYILLKQFSLTEICKEAIKIFGSVFSTELFLKQLVYFADIDLSEQVIWRMENPATDQEIKTELVKIVTANVNF